MFLFGIVLTLAVVLVLPESTVVGAHRKVRNWFTSLGK
jgi:hypothetical protein